QTLSNPITGYLNICPRKSLVSQRSNLNCDLSRKILPCFPHAHVSTFLPRQKDKHPTRVRHLASKATTLLLVLCITCQPTIKLERPLDLGGLLQNLFPSKSPKHHVCGYFGKL
ncbi:unnamed protein product, partial [Ectocarpus sp. 8 AP-2014]